MQMGKWDRRNVIIICPNIFLVEERVGFLISLAFLFPFLFPFTLFSVLFKFTVFYH